MALKLAGEEIGIQEKIETIIYQPGVKDSGDLEAGTKTITTTAEASGLGNADYNAALTLSSPDDARLVVKRIASRLAVTIDSFDTATILYCRVYVDAQDADHLLFDEDWDSAGAKLDAVDTHSAAKATILGLLKDGAAHTFYFFFWVNQANNAVISLVQLWEAVGTCTTGWSSYPLEITHTGLIQVSVSHTKVGSGTSGCHLMPLGSGSSMSESFTSDISSRLSIGNTPLIRLKGTVATDLNYISNINIGLRSLQ